MREQKCEFCEGSGRARTEGDPDVSSSPSDEDFDPNLDQKSQSGQLCEECGGTGKDLKVLPKQQRTYSRGGDYW